VEYLKKMKSAPGFRSKLNPLSKGYGLLWISSKTNSAPFYLLYSSPLQYPEDTCCKLS
jgi:hypothetical protein